MPIDSLIRTIPHYPKPGVMFRDITTLLKDPVGFRLAINDLARRYRDKRIDKVAAIESRGFIVGALVAECCFVIDLPELGSRAKPEDEAYGVHAAQSHEPPTGGHQAIPRAASGA